MSVISSEIALAQSPRILTPAESVSSPSNYSQMIPMNRIAPLRPIVTWPVPSVSMKSPIVPSARAVEKNDPIQQDIALPPVKAAVMDKPAVPPNAPPVVAAPAPAKIAPAPKPVAKKEIVQEIVKEAAPPAPVSIQWDKPPVAPPVPVIAAPVKAAPVPVMAEKPAPIARQAKLPAVKPVPEAPAQPPAPVAAPPVIAERKIMPPAPVAPKTSVPPAEPFVVQPASPPVAAAPVAAKAATRAPVPAAPVETAPAETVAAPKEKLGSVTGLDAFTPDAMSFTKAAPSGEEDELQTSLLKKIQILESEKENMRKKLNQFDPGGVGPVYQCAAETNKINVLESQVKFLSEENQALKKKNQELGMIPKLPEGSLDNLPDVKPEVESKESLNTGAGS
ncbi:MAG TPA: hypothetical protein VGF14_07825 [Alphaproteobacteria bacterium]